MIVSEPHSAATLRHDMRTLLNAILGYSELWLDEAPPEAGPDFVASLGRIHADGQWLLQQVNELLDAARLLDAGYAAGIGERLRSALDARVRQAVASIAELRAASPRAGEDVLADLARMQAAGEKLSGMLETAEAAIRGGDGATAPAPALPSSVAAPAEGGRVLVVDDNEVNRDVLARRLARDGHRVALAEDGAEALARLAAEPYDLVLLNIMMPGIDGYQVLERLRADARWADLPVIMISSVDEIESAIRCIEMGAEDYLPKPFNPVLLRARVNACLEKKRLRDERLARQKAEEERLRRELEMAARVQQRLLPSRPPEVAGVDLAAGCLPARGVGGDYFDFLRLDERHLGLVIADVAGKGMPAALVMAALAASLRSQAHQAADIVRLADALNAQMHAWTDTSKFVTLFYGCLDLCERRLRYVNAGHNPPLLVRGCTREVVPVPDVGGPVLGILPAARYVEGALDLDRGDMLAAFTDGVTEAFSAGGEEFGDERLAAALLRRIDEPAEAIRQGLEAELRGWCAGAPQSDDITLLLAKVL